MKNSDIIVLLLVALPEAAGAVVLFDQGSPKIGSNGGGFLDPGNIVADNFRLSSNSLVNEAEVFLAVPNDTVDSLQLSVFFFDGIPGLASTSILEQDATIETRSLFSPILTPASLRSIFRLSLSFEEVFVLADEFYYFGLASNLDATAFSPTEFPDGSDNIVLGRLSNSPVAIAGFSWTGAGDGSLAFSLSGTPIPEPSPLVLLAAGLSLGFCWRRRLA